jgi:hypothetical protein
VDLLDPLNVIELSELIELIDLIEPASKASCELGTGDAIGRLGMMHTISRNCRSNNFAGGAFE